MYLLSASYPLFSRSGFMNPWPDAGQLLLLKAALLAEGEAVPAWQQWGTEHWPKAQRDAGSYALFGLLHTRLPVLGPTPSGLRALMQQAHLHQLCRNQLALLDLHKTLAVFELANIRVMLFKGLPVLHFAYADLGARLSSDLDLLIADHDVQAAHQALLAAGFVTALTPDEHFCSVNHAASYTHPKQISVDLHWRPFMMDTSPRAESEFWQRAGKRPLGGREVLMPALEDLLLLTCLHGRKPSGSAVTRWVVDAMGLLNAVKTVDWPALQQRALEAGLEAPLNEAQAYLHAQFAAAPAPRPMEAEASPWAGRVIWYCCEALTRLKAAESESGLARLSGLLQRAPYVLTYNGLKFWLPRQRRGLATSPGLLLAHLWRARQLNAERLQ